MVVGPGAPTSHLHPTHKILPPDQQVTPEGRAAAEAIYNNPRNGGNAEPVDGLTKYSTLPILNSQYTIPRLGLGIYLSSPDVCVKSCLHALNSADYRHIDSAQFYQNEAEMGVAARESGISRDKLFLTTKILTPNGDLEKTYQKCRESVKKIVGHELSKTKEDRKPDEYVDLFLIHSPNAGAAARKELWLALERIHEEGLARHIGVSNFGTGQIEELKEYAKFWPPQVNQIELHPWCQQRTIVDYCNKHCIVVEAYSPLVRNQKAHDETLVAVAEKVKKSTQQVLVRYSLQKGWVTLPKSDNPTRIQSNADVYGWELSSEEMKTLDDLDQGDEGAIVEAVRNT